MSEAQPVAGVSIDEARWEAQARQLPESLRRIAEHWQSVPRVAEPRPEWHLVLAVDGEPVSVVSFATLGELVKSARSLSRLEERWTQIFCFYGRRLWHDRSPGKCLILSGTKRVPLIPWDRRRDLEADPEGFFINGPVAEGATHPT